MSSSSRMTTVGIVGAGEMGAAVGQRMRERGARVLTTLAGRSAASIERARCAGLETADDDDSLVSAAGFILSIVPPGQAAAVAERYLAPLARATEKPVFVECNAIAPNTVRKIAETLAPSGCRFVDAGIIGGPPRSERPERGPRFYTSGPDAQALVALRDYGIDVAILDGPVGAASALKMSYAGLTKGLIAIGTAMIGGASRAGLAPALLAELKRSQPELLAMFGARVPAMFPKAYRWVAEMEQIAEYLGGAANGSAIYDGAARLYEQVAAEWNERGDACASAAALNGFLR
jgi:3-hydroxyisobutyrate dehydrogenase-like beta-hydroxyacid dehydrogenase